MKSPRATAAAFPPLHECIEAHAAAAWSQPDEGSGDRDDPCSTHSPQCSEAAPCAATGVVETDVTTVSS